LQKRAYIKYTKKNVELSDVTIEQAAKIMARVGLQRARQRGNKIGRPRTMVHDPTKACRCWECRQKKSAAKKRAAKG